MASRVGIRFLSVNELFTPAELLPVDKLPSIDALRVAAEINVTSESGAPVLFGSLFTGQKTIVCFIRHFWCPLCQDYMTSITANVDPFDLSHYNISLIIISNGSHKMITSYRRIFRTPYAVFTDPSLKVYQTLGMTLKTLDGGLEKEKGSYVKHGLLSGIAMVVKNAVKARVPVWERGGDIEQLGGEFILGPGLTATYANRMTSTRAHAPVSELLRRAGVVPRRHRLREIPATLTYSVPSPEIVQEQLRDESRKLGIPHPEGDEASCGTDSCTLRSLCSLDNTDDLEDVDYVPKTPSLPSTKYFHRKQNSRPNSSVIDVPYSSSLSPSAMPSQAPGSPNSALTVVEISSRFSTHSRSNSRQSSTPRPLYRTIHMTDKEEGIRDATLAESKGEMVLRYVRGQWTKVHYFDEAESILDVEEDSLSFCISDETSTECEYYDARLEPSAASELLVC